MFWQLFFIFMLKLFIFFSLYSTCSSFTNMLARTLFASTLRRTSCNTKPQRGVTMVLEVSSVPLGRAASRFRSALCDASRLKNGWYKAARKKRAFRYATSNPCRVPTARYPSISSLPAIEMAGRSTLVASYLKNHRQMPTASLAGYHCQMPMASLAGYRSSGAPQTSG